MALEEEAALAGSYTDLTVASDKQELYENILNEVILGKELKKFVHPYLALGIVSCEYSSMITHLTKIFNQIFNRVENLPVLSVISGTLWQNALSIL